MTINLNKKDIIELSIDDLAHGGEGVGHYAKLAVFVPATIPGERVKVKITEKKKSYARAELITVLKSVPERTNPDCIVYNDCGGCQLQHIDYQKQLQYKKVILEAALTRIAKLEDFDLKEIVADDYPWSYRNKAQFPLTTTKEGKIKTGFYKQGTHQVVINEKCVIQHPLINRIKKECLAVLNKYNLSVYNERNQQGLLRHLIIRVGVCTNQALLTIVCSKDYTFPEKLVREIKRKVPELSGILQNINTAKTNVILGNKTNLLLGKPYYLDYIGSIALAISTASFLQVNTLQAKKLYDIILKLAQLTGKEIIIDAYCGIGSIALYLARKAKVVYGIEEVKKAIEDANFNSQINKIDNCYFYEGKVEEKLPLLLKKGIIPDLIIFDPPRKGLANSVIKSVLKILPAKIIYVSCNPATLARDLQLFQERYKISKIKACDLFPQTYHLETAVLLEKK